MIFPVKMRAKNEGEMFEFRFSFVSYFFSCFSFAFCSSFVRILSSYIFFSFYNLPYRSVNTFRLPFPKFSILKNKLRISAKFVIVRIIQTVTKEAIMKNKISCCSGRRSGWVLCDLGAFGEKGHPAWRYRVRGTGEASEKQRMQKLTIRFITRRYGHRKRHTAWIF